MGYMKKLLEVFPIADRVPSQHLLRDSLDITKRIQATRGKDYILVYSSAGEPVPDTTGSLKANSVKSFGSTQELSL
jgi:hypothetical protein